MATVSVSSASELQKALDNASKGDVLVLDSGNYGTLSLNGNSRQADYKFDDITITSKTASNPAVFNRVNLSNVTNVTFDDIKFDYTTGDGKPFLFNNTSGISIIDSEIDGKLDGGHGAGHGLWVINSDDFRLEGTEIKDFATGAHFRSIDNLDVVNNSFTGISYDAMLLGRIGGALIQGNDVVMKGEPGIAHRDMIQFWNNDNNDPSHDIVIRGNTLVAAETVTHGIFMANDLAHKGGGMSTYYENILIENNVIKSGQVFGILVGQTDGLTIRNNTVLQHTSIDSSRPVDTPVIRVEDDSKNVSVTGNTTHRNPEAVSSDENWQSENRGTPNGWTISGNKIASIGTDSGGAGGSGSGGGSGGSSGGGGGVAPSGPSGNSGNGRADTFRFDGSKIDGRETATYKNVDFSEGDKIILTKFEKGTFDHYAGDNQVTINAAKSHVVINSIVDLQEIVTAAKDVTAKITGDKLVVSVAQDDGSFHMTLPGMGELYQDSFDKALF